MDKSLRLYVIIMTFVVGIVFLLIYFIALPKLMNVITEISEIQAEKMKSRILLTMIGYFFFAFVINLLTWKIDNDLEKEEIEIQGLLKINPADLHLHEKLVKINSKKKLYLALIEPILIAILGLIVGFISITIIKPLYTLILGD